MKKTRAISRRGFLARSAATAAAAAAGPLILPSGVLAAPGRPGANDRIVTGHIGVGGMGRYHLGRMRDHVGAICDVDAEHCSKAAEQVKLNVPLYGDYRRVLDRKDIDAVFIAAPDHWHGIIAVHACEAGKDVYVEKPASKTVEEGRAMINAARRYGRVMQVGSQGRSQPASYATCQFIRNGQLGEVKRVECWHEENWPGGDPTKFCDPPPHLDWDMWLGPARWRPYTPEYCHFNFRWMLDFGGGFIRDRGAHVLSVVSWFLGLDGKGPVRVTATGEPRRESLWDTPRTMDVTWEFDDPELTIVWGQPGKPAAEATFGQVYYGSKDTLVFRGGDGGCGTEDKALNYTPPSDGPYVYKSTDHDMNFMECVKTREKPIMDIEAGHSVATMCILANMSYRLGRPIQWDAKAERCVGDEQANRMLSNPGRGPWHL
ncbi:MAG: Gfo/Idh/MocA family oxidoreductase [Candidatus Hydrogenedentes bacterium]|nr:Gfo/Idh/MocA family oxidoreductase [Candidatus Hydrogenedentota bacterium]